MTDEGSSGLALTASGSLGPGPRRAVGLVHHRGHLAPRRRDARCAGPPGRPPTRAGGAPRRGGTRSSGVVEAEPATARRLARVNLVAAVSFVLGGSLFALGALLAEFGVGSVRTVDIVYLVGGVFFSLGGYASVLQAVNAPTDIDEDGSLSSAALALVELAAPRARLAQRGRAVRRAPCSSRSASWPRSPRT